ncbi:MAG TPA: DNA alkylation repair protein [Candidatus Saccharimonadales bacterium]|jgi:3-methyladenine DNA glycosylase AlkD
MSVNKVKQALNKLADPVVAQVTAQSFKIGKEYESSKKFLGLKVPAVREICKQYRTLPLGEIEKLLASPIHEHRLAALIIMVEQAKKANPESKKQLHDLYLRRIDEINNWELVDVSCHYVLGGYLMDKPRDVLYELARSNDAWRRRIAIVSTWQFIRSGQADDTFAIAEILLADTQPSVQKAVGWMLREAGKRVDEKALTGFLERHYQGMSRTTLRYAIERLSSVQKAHFMNKPGS